MTEDTKNPEIKLSTKYGNYHLKVWPDSLGKEHLALKTINFNPNEVVTLRVHSECLTGDVFSSKHCDCGEQLSQSMKLVLESNNGLIIYLRQEGRGIGLAAKIKAYELQHAGLDTEEANLKLGFDADQRDYSHVISILNKLNVKKVNIITNNPQKIQSITESGIKVNRRISIQTTITNCNQAYIQTKIKKFGHLIDSLN